MTSPSRFILSTLVFCVCTLLATVGVPDVHGQSGMRSVGAVGSGGGASALSTGPAAMYSNPANLTVGPPNHNVEIRLFQVGAYTGGDAYQFSHYKTLFTQDRLLSDEEKTTALNEWFGSAQRSTATYVELTPLALTYRSDDGQWAVGLGLRGRTIQRTDLDKGLFDLLLRGMGPERTVSVSGRSRVYSIADVKAAFSYRFSSIPLSIGISPSVVLGLGYSGGRLSSTVEVGGDSLVHQFDYAARAAGAMSTGLFDNFNAFQENPISGDDVMGKSSGIAGYGGGVDLGATYEIRPGLHASLSVTDLGVVRWSQDAQTVSPESNAFQYGGIDPDKLDGNIGDQIESKLDSLTEEAYRNVERDRSPFRTGLPTTAHVSSTWDQGIFVFNGGLSVGLNDAAGAVPDPVAVHVGSKLDAGPIPIRLGVRALGSQAVTVSGSFGLDVGFYNLEVAASVTPNTSTLGSGARYAVGLSLGTIRM